MIKKLGEGDAKYTYGGKELDDETNLYYFNARYYDATIGRFINVDPIQDGTNWYVYCNNNPLCFVDPTGLESLQPIASGQKGHNAYFYVADSKLIDSYTTGLGYIPFGGLAVMAAKWLADIPMKMVYGEGTINLNDQKVLKTSFETGVHVLGSMSEFLKNSKYLSVASSWASFLDAGLTTINLINTLTDPHYNVEKAVELTGLVAWDNKECAIFTAKYAEAEMKNMMDKGYVELTKNKNGIQEINWLNKDAQKEFTDSILNIKFNWSENQQKKDKIE